jgi:predicted metal-dependent phosphoesterase TrpH
MDNVVFEKPDHKKLSRKYTVVDMHSHTRASHDCNTKIKRFADRLKSLGIGAAVTDHDEIDGSLALKRRYPKLFVIPGIEATSLEDKDILLYFNSFDDLKGFYNRHILPNKKKHRTNAFTIKTRLPYEYILDVASDYNAFRVLPHPLMRGKGIFRRLKRKKDFSVLKRVDGIEAINAGQKLKYNIRGLTWAGLEKKPVTGGSDSHIIKTIGDSVTISTATSVEGFIESIRKKKNHVVGYTSNFMSELSSLGSIMRNKIRLVKNKKRVKVKLKV